MGALKVCLWVAGFGCLLSLFGLFMPIESIEAFAKAFGGQAFPQSPIFLYAIRVMAATYVAAGAFYIILAVRPMNYGGLVPVSGVAAAFVGVVCWATGLAVGMPPVWYLGDALSCIVLGILIVLFWRRAKKASGT